MGDEDGGRRGGVGGVLGTEGAGFAKAEVAGTSSRAKAAVSSPNSRMMRDVAVGLLRDIVTSKVVG